ncbi:MAG: HD domain-containing protein [Desulfobacteraceae bacterium]|nr:MAG: HD domain-containing protein [Desulfobacteraceae bacterium]
MKKKYVNQIQSGEIVDDVFILSDKILSQKKDGGHYLNFVFADKTGNVKGVAWDQVDTIKDRAVKGDFVRVKGTISEYRGALQMIVKSLDAVGPDAVNAADFIAATSRNVDKMIAQLKDIVETVQTGYLKELLNRFFNDAQWVEKFKRAPAAKMMHHAYIGGLLEHTLSLAVLVNRVADHYSGIDRDLLMTGAILHDIGKIEEFEYSVRIDYSDAGRLVNHIVIGLEMLGEKIAQVENFPENAALLLKHLIVSHHGAREFGSPEPPKTLEGLLLNYLDEIDSKINGIREFMESQDTDDNWTGYHKPMERYFYKGRLK